MSVPARRTLLGTSSDLGTRQRVYETADAVVVDEANGFALNRRRVYYDEVVLVTHHAFVGWPLAVLLAVLATIAGSVAGLLAVGRSFWAAVVLGALAIGFLTAMVLRFLVKTDAVTVYGRRSQARAVFWVRRRRARAIFSRLCARVLRAQEKAVPAAAAPLPASFETPGPPEVV